MEEKKTLKEIRESRGIKQKFVAGYLGVSDRTVRNKENGRTPWKTAEIAVLCDLYRCDVSEVAG